MLIRRRVGLATLRRFIALALCSTASTWLVHRYVFAIYIIEGSSMAPTLHDGDTALVNMMAGAWGNPSRGEIVLVQDGSGGYATKRVVGLPGERIDIVDQKVRVNGRLLRENYLRSDTVTVSPCPTFYLGKNEYFVLGDNRSDSFDSRCYGPVSGNRIVGSYTRNFWAFR